MSLIEDIGLWLFNVNKDLLIIWKYLPFILMGITFLILRHYFMFPKKDDGIRYVSWKHSTMRWLVPVLTVVTTIMWSKTYGFNMIVVPATAGFVLFLYWVVKSDLNPLWKFVIVIIVCVVIVFILFNFQFFNSIGGGAI